MKHIIYGLGKTFYYTAPLTAMITPDVRTTNAMLGIMAAGLITKLAAGTILAGKKALDDEKNKTAGYTEKSSLSKLFDKAKGSTVALALMGGTALGAVGYTAANTVHDLNNSDRAWGWTVAGNVVDTAYRPTRFVLDKAADLGQAFSQNLNPIPEQTRENLWPVIPGTLKAIDGLAFCFDDAMMNTPRMAGTCSSGLQGTINPIIDRRMP